MSDAEFDSALDLLRRLDPRHVELNLNKLCKQSPGIAEDLLSTVDQPLKVKTCPTSSKPFLCCDYNRDGDSFRSPHSNEFTPHVPDAIVPSDELRKLEITANDAFDTYRELYFEGGLSSVYLWEQDDGFAGVVLIRKTVGKSVWNSIHVFEVEPVGKRATYRLTSTIILELENNGLDLSGSLTRQLEKSLPVGESVDHVANIGQLVEELESKLRNLLNEVYFGKTRDIVGDLRTVESQKELAEDRARQGSITKGLEE